MMTYHMDEPKVLPKGTIITCAAAFESSVNNASNPNPKLTVEDGRPRWEEMMAGFVDFGFSPTQSLDVFHDAPKVDASKATAAVSTP